MATYDLTAEIEVIKNVTGAEQVNYIGYSQGALQMLYALVRHEEDFFIENVNQVVALAPCVYIESEFETKEQLTEVFKQYEEEEIYWTTSQILPTLPDKKAKVSEPMSVAYQLHIQQIALEDRFQEFIPLDTYAASNETESPLLDLREIRHMKINLIIPELDDVCLPTNAHRIYHELETPNKAIRFVRDNGALKADHEYFKKVTGKRFVLDLIDSIEENTDEDIRGMDALEVGNRFIAAQFKQHPKLATSASALILIVGFGCFGFWAIICVACAAARHKRSGDKIVDGDEYSSDSESAKNSDSEVSSDMDAIPMPIAED